MSDKSHLKYMHWIKAMAFFILVLGFSKTIAYSISSEAINQFKQDTVFHVSEVDSTPTPEKGMDDLYKKFAKNLKIPKEYWGSNLTVKVTIQFPIYETGSAVHQIINPTGESFEDAVLASFNKMRIKWIPGMKDGRPVKVRFELTMPISLKSTG